MWANQLLRALPWLATNKAYLNLVQDQSQIWEGAGKLGEACFVSTWHAVPQRLQLDAVGGCSWQGIVALVAQQTFGRCPWMLLQSSTWRFRCTRGWQVRGDG